MHKPGRAGPDGLSGQDRITRIRIKLNLGVNFDEFWVMALEIRQE